MFTEVAELYDVMYGFKNYAGEAERVRERIVEQGGPGEGTLLDVACGTGGHTGPFRAWYQVEGLDLHDGLLAVARRKLPGVPFHHADMRGFDLGRAFDVVTCMFSSIGYVQTEEGLRAAVAAMARHVRPGGALVIEPWVQPRYFEPGILHLLTHDEEELKIARISRGDLEDGLCILNFFYLIGEPAGVRNAHERHVLGLFTKEQTMEAMEAQGLRVFHDEKGPIGRGLYVGIKE